MVVDMVTATASTYLGGGDLSWQAINWSTPDALSVVPAGRSRLRAEDGDGRRDGRVGVSAFLFDITTKLGATPTFAEFMTAIGSGYSDVFTNSGRTADTIYMAPDRYGYLLGLTSNGVQRSSRLSTARRSGR
jgi:hypothetical protein